MTVVYGDLAFLLNSGLDYLILCCALRLSGLPLCHRRIAPAALLGGAYGVAALLPSAAFLASVWGKCAVALVMVRIAFGRSMLFLRHYFLFLVSACTLSGAVTGIEAVFFRTQSPWMIFLLSSAFCVFSLMVIFHRGAGCCDALVRAELTCGRRRVAVTLFCDSGNTLRDPVEGKIICIVWREALEPLLTEENILYRKIPFQTLGSEEALLTYFYCTTLRIGKRTWKNYPVGIAEHPLSDGGGFVGLWGGVEKGGSAHDGHVAGKTT